MKDYLANLLPRIRQYSLSLDKMELFIDKPWVLVDTENNLHKYIFRRNNDLLMSVNGNVVMGKWDYIPAAKSLLIDRGQDKILLNQDFVDQAVMLLKKDGNKDEPFMLANELIIPDLNIAGYLQQLLNKKREQYYEKYRISPIALANGEFLEIANSYSGLERFRPVTVSMQPIYNAFLESVNGEKFYDIRQGKLFDTYIIAKYIVNNKTIEVCHSKTYGLQPKNMVQFNKKPLPDGKYRLSFLKYIHVKDGRITKISAF